MVLITGGCRSGKSAHALGLGLSLPGPRAFVATSPVLDEEMAQRVQLHRQARNGQDWLTIEEPTRLAEVFRQHGNFGVLLVDCVTLWINNLMFEAQQAGQEITEKDLEPVCREMLDTAAAVAGTVIFVTNEVGLGVVPDNPLARRFRDLVGRTNQWIAARADRVVLLCAGLPILFKPGQGPTA